MITVKRSSLSTNGQLVIPSSERPQSTLHLELDLCIQMMLKVNG